MQNKFLFIFLLVSISISSMPVYAGETGEEFTIKANDVLEINVLDHKELSTKVPVALDGSITFPYLGSLNVKGKTLLEVEKEITDKLGNGFVNYPVVSVKLSIDKVEIRYEKFYMFGAVVTPGEYDLEEDITVLKAISLAGGITPEGLYGDVKVRRKKEAEQEYKEILTKGVGPDGIFGDLKVRRRQSEIIPIDLKGKKENIANGDMLLEAGDIVMVGRNNSFYIFGAVKNPGKYIVEDDTTVLQAISIAGGFSKYGSLDRVKILKKIEGEEGYKSIKVDLKSAVKGESGKDTLIEPNDIVMAMEGML